MKKLVLIIIVMLSIGCAEQKETEQKENDFLSSIKTSLNTEDWKHSEDQIYSSYSKDNIKIDFWVGSYTYMSFLYVNGVSIDLTSTESEEIAEECFKVRQRYFKKIKDTLFKNNYVTKKKFRCRNKK